jgi:alanine dehydrogenase
MKIGVPKEIKTLEFRVGMTPAGVHDVIHDGHEVVVETNAGAGIGVTDADYEAAGAKVLGTAEEVFEQAEMIIKVKEPQLNECAMLRPDQVLFTYLHLAPDPKQTEALVKSGTTAIAYETVTANDGSLPLLTPMSVYSGWSFCFAESQRWLRQVARRRARRTACKCPRYRRWCLRCKCGGHGCRPWR